MKVITKKEAKRLENLEVDCENKNHEWVQVDNPLLPDQWNDDCGNKSI